MSEPSRETLLKAGVHHGHLSKRWNPDFKPFLFMKRVGNHVINVDQTIKYLVQAGEEMKKLTETGKKILFVGRKKQAKGIIAQAAQRLQQPYVTERWLGGTLTNFITIKKLLKKMLAMDRYQEDPDYIHLTKKEKLIIDRRKKKLEVLLGGISMLMRPPAALFVVDVNREYTAVQEAHKLGIPVFAIIDSNASPHLVDHPIPGNDDAGSAIEVLVAYLAAQIEEGNRLWEANKKLKEESVKTSKAVESTRKATQPRTTAPKGTDTVGTSPKTTSKTPANTTVSDAKVTSKAPTHTSQSKPKAAPKSPANTPISSLKTTFKTPANTTVSDVKVTSKAPTRTSQSKPKTAPKSPANTPISSPKTTSKTPANTTVSDVKVTSKDPTRTSQSKPKTAPKSPANTPISSPKTTSKTPANTTVSDVKVTSKAPTRTSQSKPKTAPKSPVNTPISNTKTTSKASANTSKSNLKAALKTTN